MKDLIINSLEIISKISIVFMVTSGFLGGWMFGGLLSALFGAVVAFIAAVTIFGGVFVLLEINEHVRALRRLAERGEPSSPPVAEGSGPHA